MFLLACTKALMPKGFGFNWNSCRAVYTYPIMSRFYIGFAADGGPVRQFTSEKAGVLLYNAKPVLLTLLASGFFYWETSEP